MRFLPRTLLAVLMIPAAALAAEWDLAYQPPATLHDVSLQGFSDASAGGFWATGRTTDTDLFLHYDASGAVGASARAGLPGELAQARDGGFYSVFSAAGACSAARYDAAGHMLWSRALQGLDPAQNFAACARSAVDGENGFWIGSVQFDHLAADGSTRISKSAAELGFATIRDLAADPTTSAVVVVGIAPGPIEHARAVRVLGSGAIAWTWTDTDAARSQLTRVRVAADGSVLALGDAGADATRRLLTVALSGAGAQVARNVLADFGQAAASHPAHELVAARDGTLFAKAIANESGVTQVLHFGATGALLSRLALAASTTGSKLRPTRDGGVALLTRTDAGSANPAFALARLRANGQALGGASLAQCVDATGLAVLDADDSVAVLCVPAGVGAQPTTLRFDRNGGTLAPLTTAVAPFSAASFVALGGADNGAAYLLTRSKGGLTLDGIAPDGTLAWSRRIDFDVAAAELVSGANRVCASLRTGVTSPIESTVQCFDAASGDARARYTVNRARIATVGTSSVRYWGTVGGVTGLFDQGSGAAQRIAAAATAFDLAHLATNGVGDVLLAGVDPAGKGQLTLVDANGSVRFGPIEVPGEFGSNIGRSATLFADGSSVVVNKQVVEDGSRALFVRHYNATGQPLWTRRLDGRYSRADLADESTGVYLVLGNPQTPSLLLPTRVTRLALAGGTSVWQRDTAAPYNNLSRGLFVDRTAPGRVLHAFTRGNELGLERYALADGTMLDGARKSCGGTTCEWPAMRTDSRGALFAAAAIDRVGSATRSALFRLDDAFAPPEATERPDQAALEGAWYFPGTSGQGLLHDYIGASRTTFLTWFTFGTGGSALDPAGLRWYTLQGTVTPQGDPDIALTIYRNSGGRFAAAPATNAERVGTAHLIFTACDRAVLDYEFDPGVNDATRGTLPLERLTSPSAACVGLGGSPEHPQTASAGFDVRQSGSWYDPATSGQGFSFVVRPGAGGSVFGAWFTYDPAGASDDPAAQHWFTLQGSLAGASGGTVVLPVYRTIGGAFDAGSTSDTQRVGEATVRFDGCTSARVDYRFDAIEVAGAFAGRSGTIALIGTSGACTP